MAELADEIVRLLAPAIGTGLAESAVNVQCKKMGMMPEDLSHETLLEFAERFRTPLGYFAGEAVAAEIVGKIKVIRIHRAGAAASRPQ